MLIRIALNIDEEKLQEGLKILGKSRVEFRRKLTESLADNMGETIEDNWELFDEIEFEVD
jgi:hypothetical protein